MDIKKNSRDMYRGYSFIVKNSFLIFAQFFSGSKNLLISQQSK